MTLKKKKRVSFQRRESIDFISEQSEIKRVGSWAARTGVETRSYHFPGPHVPKGIPSQVTVDGRGWTCAKTVSIQIGSGKLLGSCLSCRSDWEKGGGTVQRDPESELPRDRCYYVVA